MAEVLLWILVAGLAAVLALQILALLRLWRSQGADFETKLATLGDRLERMEKSFREEQQANRDEIRRILGDYNAAVLTQMKSAAATQDERGDRLEQTLKGRLQESGDQQRASFEEFSKRLERLTETTEKRAENLRATVEKQLQDLREGNEKRLEQMRQTVDEKLQGTLEKRLGESFEKVSKSLENVYQTMGEMKQIGTDVSDFKRVLTNVKSRGTWGEIQLGTLLEEILAASQFERNVRVDPSRNETVEFCVKLPGRDAEAGHIWLPIDSKFPKEDYERLVDASQAGDQTQVEAAGTELERTVRKFAREVSEKYIHPPATTDFAILFMPSEGLYAEVLRRPGLAESLQREQRIVLAGPTNIVALLNSLQMGFRTLAIQKRSGEVWRVLGAVKTEFGKFGDVLDKLKKKLHQAGNDVENAKVRTRAMERRLRDVEALPEGESTGLLSLEDEGSAEHDGDEEPPEERRSV